MKIKSTTVGNEIRVIIRELDNRYVSTETANIFYYFNENLLIPLGVMRLTICGMVDKIIDNL